MKTEFSRCEQSGSQDALPELSDEKISKKGFLMRIFVTVVVVVLVVLVIVSGLGWYFSAKTGKSGQKSTKVRIEAPVYGNLVEIVCAPGQVEPKTKVSISARVSARIVELPFKEGDRVTKGDSSADPPIPPSVLVRLDATDLEAALKSVEARRAAQAAEIEVTRAQIASQEADIEGVRASLADAERDFARQQKLLETGDVSQSAYDEAKCSVDELKSRLSSSIHTLRSRELSLDVKNHHLSAADAEIAQAKDRLTYTTITSPIDGIVTRVNAEVGELVVTGTMNNPGTEILSVADLSNMLVVAQVNEADIGGVEKDQKTIVRIPAYPDEEFTGTVDSIALTGTGTSREGKDFMVEILLDTNAKRIYWGLTADVEIETHRYEDVLKIPSQAVLGRRVDELPTEIRDDNPSVDDKKTFATVVYRFNDHKAVVTPVTVGPSDPTHVAIRSGLDENDRVIVGPYKVLENLKHNKKVVDERQSAATQPVSEESDDDQDSKKSNDKKHGRRRRRVRNPSMF
ncbi:MAG: efflux RND transporter periplasmic adaptor subunit [Planctomycetota bacterium]